MKGDLTVSTQLKHKHIPWFLWPFWAIWRLFELILGFTGRIIGVVLGLVLLIVGLILCFLVITLPVGIPLVVVGGLLVIRALF